MTNHEIDNKILELIENQEEIVKRTGNVLIWSTLLWMSLSLSATTLSLIMDTTDPASSFIYGFTTASGVGLSTFEVNKIAKNLKERKVYIKKFDKIYEELEKENVSEIEDIKNNIR